MKAGGARTLFVITIVVAVVAGVGRAGLRVSHGLTAEYFATVDRSGPPVATGVDAEPSAATTSKHWPGPPLENFSARWRGYLAVPRSDVYRLATTSDDGSWVYVDGRLVVDNGGTHGILTKSSETFLPSGPHFILVEYFQAGGPSALELSWARGADALAPVPAWLLTQRRTSYARLRVARLLAQAMWVSVLAALGLGGFLAASHRQGQSARWIAHKPRLASLVLFVVLAIVHTWPLASSPARLSRNDNGDTLLNTWIVAWVIHAAPRSPLHFFDANIFYPEPNTLAYSEALLVQSALGAPLVWLGASPVLTYNILLIAGFALTGWATCLVLARWTGDWWAGLAGGIALGFNAHTLTRMPHLQAQHVEFLPLALLAFDRLLVEPRVRHALSFGVWFALQAMASFYLFVMTSIGFAAAIAVRPEDWMGKRASRVALCLALAGAVAAIVLLPYLLPYWRLSHGGFTRPIDEVAAFAATWRDYLTTPGRLPRLFLAKWATGNGLYPGAVALFLAGVAIVGGSALRDPRPRMCLAFGVIGVVFSFGPQVPGYTWLYNVFTPLQAIRAVGRFGYLAIVATAVLAAYGLVAIRRRILDPNWRTAISVGLLVILALEPLAAPVGYSEYTGIPRIYERVAAEKGAVIVELPLPMRRGAFFNAPFLLNSTVHWKPMINGYSGFVPDSYVEHYNQLSDFPAPDAIAALRRLRVTHAFVHLNSLAADKRADVDRAAGLVKLASERDIVLYQVANSASVSR